MLLGAELALLIYGIYALIKGEFGFSKDYKITAWRARVCGAACLVPIPLMFAIGIVYGIVLVVGGTPPEDIEGNTGLLTLIEIAVVISTLIGVFFLAKYFKSQEPDQVTGKQVSTINDPRYG